MRVKLSTGKRVITRLLSLLLCLSLLTGCNAVKTEQAIPVGSGEETAAEPDGAAGPEAESEEEFLPEDEGPPIGPYTVLDTVLPEPYDQRKLSDEELEALGWTDIDMVRQKISTVADAVAWIELQDFTYIDGDNWSNGADSELNLWLISVPEHFSQKYLIYTAGIPMFGANTVSLLAAWLLQDDIPDACVFYASPYIHRFEGSRERCCPAVSLLCLPETDGYILLDISALLPSGQRDTELFTFGNALRTDDLQALADWLGPRQVCCSDDKYEQAYSEVVLLEDLDSPTYYKAFVDSPSTFEEKEGLTLLYAGRQAVDDESYLIRELTERLFSAEDCMLPEQLGIITLTDESAARLNKGSLAEAAAAVKTLGDVVQYFYSGGFTYGMTDIWESDGEVDWHFNQSAETVNRFKMGSCGGLANLVCCLLWGDYDEVGYMNHTYRNGEGGGHVYNYIRQNGRYNVFDMTSLLGWNYIATTMWVEEMDSLTEYPDAAENHYGFLPVIYAYSAPREIPLAWGRGSDGCSVTWYPEGTEITVLRETPHMGYRLDYRPMSEEVSARIEEARAPFVNNTQYNRVTEETVFSLPQDLAGAAFGYAEAREMAWNISLEEAASKITTLEEALLFWKASGYYYGGSDSTAGGPGYHTWHFNRHAERGFLKPELNCGDNAALLRYLLDGDYDEVGIMACTWEDGKGGGHVFNYILSNGTYYIVDMSLYAENGYPGEPVGVLKLGENLQKFRSAWALMYSKDQGMKVAYCYSNLREIPLSWDSVNGVYITWLPEKYSSDVTILFEEDGYTVQYTELSDDLENAFNSKRA